MIPLDPSGQYPTAREIMSRELVSTEKFARKCDDSAALLEVGDPKLHRWLKLSVELRDTLNGRGPWAD